MTARRTARAALSPTSAPPLVDDPLPFKLQHWQNFMPEIVLDEDDDDFIDQHLKNNPSDTRSAAEWLWRSARARRIQRDELREWCRQRDLLDPKWGGPNWSRIVKEVK